MVDNKNKIFFQTPSQALNEEWLSAVCYALTHEALESKLEDLLNKERNSIQLELPSPDIYKYVVIVSRRIFLIYIATDSQNLTLTRTSCLKKQERTVLT